MIFEFEKKELIDLGYLKETVHPNGELFLYNYTQSAQFDKAFVKYPILSHCRGLVLDKEGRIIARPFAKFFNYEEYGPDSVLGALPPWISFEITDKLDGSLGICFIYKGEIYIVTRGSFDSDQAKWAIDYLKRVHGEFIEKIVRDYNPLNTVTYLFEIIYAENRIVVNYSYYGLVLLGININNNCNFNTYESFVGEYPYDFVAKFGEIFRLPVVKNYDGITDFKTIREQLPRDNAEGFVVKFDNGLRVKLKYADYVRLHKIITGISSKTIWEMLKAGDDLKILVEKVPDEFHKWVDSTVKELKLKYDILETDAKMSYILCKDFPTRKDKAIYLMEHDKELSSIVFKMIDKKGYSDLIWNMIKPEYEQPFKTGEIE